MTGLSSGSSGMDHSCSSTSLCVTHHRIDAEYDLAEENGGKEGYGDGCTVSEAGKDRARPPHNRASELHLPLQNQAGRCVCAAKHRAQHRDHDVLINSA